MTNLWRKYFTAIVCPTRIPTVAVIGTRKPTTHGKETTYKLASELARKDVVVVSELALGVGQYRPCSCMRRRWNRPCGATLRFTTYLSIKSPQFSRTHPKIWWCPHKRVQRNRHDCLPKQLFRAQLHRFRACRCNPYHRTCRSQWHAQHYCTHPCAARKSL